MHQFAPYLPSWKHNSRASQLFKAWRNQSSASSGKAKALLSTGTEDSFSVHDSVVHCIFMYILFFAESSWSAIESHGCIHCVSSQVIYTLQSAKSKWHVRSQSKISSRKGNPKISWNFPCHPLKVNHHIALKHPAQCWGGHSELQPKRVLHHCYLLDLWLHHVRLESA